MIGLQFYMPLYNDILQSWASTAGIYINNYEMITFFHIEGRKTAICFWKQQLRDRPILGGKVLIGIN